MILPQAATRGPAGHRLAGVEIEALEIVTDEATTPGAARAAAAKALGDALQNAGPVVLEPVMRLEVDAPERCVGDVLSDLAVARRAKVLDVAAQNDRSVVAAHAPLETLLGYATALRSMTAGEAHFAQAFSHLGVRG